MLLSMTGFGSASLDFEDKTISVEVRSLNSKFTDLRIKMPQAYKGKEAELRKMISDKAERGKLDVVIDVKTTNGDGDYGLNKQLFRKYHSELAALSEELNLTNSDLLQAILKLPNVIGTESGTLSDEEWDALRDATSKAMESFIGFRRQEGAAMEEDCKKRTTNILALLKELKPFEEARVTKVRARLQQNMDEYIGKDNIDANRFEQEILYYLEKIDITEEKVRLEQHCNYFLSEMAKGNNLKGRKLSFVGQEMGREINTLGSKANSSDIQRIVVNMKDELEKIKEQVANTV